MITGSCKIKIAFGASHSIYNWKSPKTERHSPGFAYDTHRVVQDQTRLPVRDSEGDQNRLSWEKTNIASDLFGRSLSRNLPPVLRTARVSVGTSQQRGSCRRGISCRRRSDQPDARSLCPDLSSSYRKRIGNQFHHGVSLETRISFSHTAVSCFRTAEVYRRVGSLLRSCRISLGILIEEWFHCGSSLGINHVRSLAILPSIF